MKPNEIKDKIQQNKKFLWVYIIVLFSIAMALILISYISQIRMKDELNSLNQRYSTNLATTEGTLKKIEALQQASEEQDKEIEALKRQLEAAIEMGVDTILTSGQQQSAIQGAEL